MTTIILDTLAIIFGTFAIVVSYETLRLTRGKDESWVSRALHRTPFGWWLDK